MTTKPLEDVVQAILGPLFLSWFLAAVPFNTWLISSWEENKCCYKLRQSTKLHLFHSKWSELSFKVKIVDILSVAQLVTTVIFFSAWDKSRVKWDHSRNSTEKMRTLGNANFILYPNRLESSKVIILTALLMGNFVWMIYQGSLISELIAPKVTKPFQDLKTLVESNYRFVVFWSHEL